MIATDKGSLRLFRVFGIQVFLHWSWFLVAFYQISQRKDNYSTMGWAVVEYLALFLIVLVHEFGHALACRQVKGLADTIVLWPLGGIAYVRPPPRPGAELWSIAAGPLVNVILLPVLFGLQWLSISQGWTATTPELRTFLSAVAYINVAILIFNLLPIYPLDGGQILRALLWFAVGRSLSLYIATIVGFIGVIGGAALSLYFFPNNALWTLVLGYFVFQQCWSGFQYARALRNLERAPRQTDCACPTCRTAPPKGASYVCGQCNTPFDPFATGGKCPHCSNTAEIIRCLHCGNPHPLSDWFLTAPK